LQERAVVYPGWQNQQQAVVLGADLSGLLAARVLVDYFQQVTLISAQPLPTTWQPPRTFEQALPLHILAVPGQRHLESLFPGLVAELVTAGAPTIDWLADAPMRLAGRWVPRQRSDYVSRPVTTNLLRQHLLRRLRAYAGQRLTVIENCDPEQIQWRAPRCLTLKSTDGPAELAADLLVDTAGWPSRWCPRPPATIIPNPQQVVAQLVRQPRGFQAEWQALLTWDAHTSGVLMPVENQHWLVALAGDQPDLMALAADLGTPLIRDLLNRSQPVSPVFATEKTAHHWWHYEKLDTWPDHLMVTQIARWHPIYGLDLTASTLAAQTLREILAEQRTANRGQRFQRVLAQRYAPWLTVARLLAADHCLGHGVRWYGRHLLAAAQSDSRAYRAALNTLSLAAPLTSLVHPAVLQPALRRPTTPRDHFAPQPPPKIITQELAALSPDQRG
jgi:hypothetical protein